MYGYETLINEGTDKICTAIVVKEGISLTNIKLLPSSRGMAGLFKDTWLINIYAPSGAENRHEQKKMFTHDLGYLLPTCQRDIVLAGDFNCVISPSDCTGSPNTSKALSSTIQGLALHDVWESPSQQPHYSHYTNAGATRIDRIHIIVL